MAVSLARCITKDFRGANTYPTIKGSNLVQNGGLETQSVAI